MSLSQAIDLAEAATQLAEATNAKKCWGCGCFHNSLEAMERAYPAERRPAELDAAIRAARERLTEIRYDCLGCEVCYPPLAMNALNIDGEACPTEAVERRAGWPPLPGAYTVLRYQAPVAVCALAEDTLAAAVAAAGSPDAGIVGTLFTENLGIERIIQNVIANPNIRFLILCGRDSKHAIGHLPGQSLLALARAGVDERARIIGARGKRPILRNLSREAVEHFRRTVEVVDRVGAHDAPTVLAAVTQCAARDPGPADSFAAAPAVSVVQGHVPERMVADPAGYFVVYLDHRRRTLSLEHYAVSGALDAVIEGRTAAELYIPAVEKGLLSRLDHAAYLGRELARAEQALLAGQGYVQDAAPEQSSCGCGSPCGESKP